MSPESCLSYVCDRIADLSSAGQSTDFAGLSIDLVVPVPGIDLKRLSGNGFVGNRSSYFRLINSIATDAIRYGCCFG